MNCNNFRMLKFHISNGAESPLRHHLEIQESSKKPAKLTAWRVFCFLRLQRCPATSFDIPQMGAPHQRRGNPLQRGSTPKTGAIPVNGQFFDRVMNNFPFISAYYARTRRRKGAQACPGRASPSTTHPRRLYFQNCKATLAARSTPVSEKPFCPLLARRAATCALACCFTEKSDWGNACLLASRDKV